MNKHDDGFVPDEQFPSKSAVVWELSRLAREARNSEKDVSKQIWVKINALMVKYNIGESISVD